jgi:hypothetical protein
VPKLKRHLLTGIFAEKHSSESLTSDHDDGMAGPSQFNPNSVLFNHNCMYRHNIIHVNYTTYDVQHSQHVINPSTSHCNVMVLANIDEDDDYTSGHMFTYARVLGIYHVNVICVESGMYRPR